ncbi:MAG: prephenate dehydrogenase/arogenate dehydrogenase family protein [Planctomycetota bacterium]|nr:prephenate dehydrogenase/arogenate dehydrogenase family protein [Planctomycetota bacterium]
MKKPIFKKVTVVGVGLLGGSIGLSVKAADERIGVVGVGRRSSSLDRALDAGAIDEATLSTSDGVAGADMIVLATPLGAYEKHLLAMRDALSSGAVVTDVGSTKSVAVRLAEGILGKGGPFVGSHPMAGSERRGVQFAKADLFAGATCIVTPTARTRPAATRKALQFWKMLGGLTVRMSPASHDRAVARVSHLPHVLAALIVAGQKVGDLTLAGRGFLDTTRIASADPEMWRDIILTNRKPLLNAIDAADEQLIRLRDLIDLGDAAGIRRYLTSAKKRRDKLLARRMRQEE